MKDKFMSLDILKAKLKENNISGVYLFCGAEEYTKDHYASLIRNKVDSSPLPEFNHLYFNIANDSISDLEDAIYSLPYMWDVKLIEITDIESAKLLESDIEDYARVFSDIPDYITILIVMRHNDDDDDKGDKEKGQKKLLNLFIKAVRENGLVVEFENEKADKLSTWITRHLNAKNIKFDYSVPRELINVCGNDMYILQGEILKLAEIYNGTPISVSDVRKYCCSNSAYKYFDIVSALNKRDIVLANKILYSLNLDRESISMAVGFLAKEYAEMLMVKLGIDSGKNLELISKETKIKDWICKKKASAVGKTDVSVLNFAISELTMADKKIKSYRGNPLRILELAFYRICTYGR